MAIEPSALTVTSADEQIVIPLRATRRARFQFAALSVVLTVGSVTWIALSPSRATIIYGGFMIAALAWVWATRLAARRARGNAPLEIMATREGISSPLWSIAWNRVDRIWIGPTAWGRLQALHIEPMRPADVDWSRSKAMRFNARVSDAMKMAPIQIPQENADRPLQELAVDLQRVARRPLM